MEKYYTTLKNITLFKDINEKDFPTILTCLNARKESFEKDNFIIMTGDMVHHIGILLTGNAHIIKEDIDGERLVVSTLTSRDYFAEVICCAGVASPVSVVAGNHCEIMFLQFGKLFQTCSQTCNFHTQLIRNMLYVISQKNLHIQNRLDIISKNSTRKKVLAYLESLSHTQNDTITIPFNREELADYLCVERTSLSHELSRMKKDGLIEYNKNKFLIL